MKNNVKHKYYLTSDNKWSTTEEVEETDDNSNFITYDYNQPEKSNETLTREYHQIVHNFNKMQKSTFE